MTKKDKLDALTTIIRIVGHELHELEYLAQRNKKLNKKIEALYYYKSQLVLELDKLLRSKQGK
jgi:hypothetical protein